jgi:methanethiol S-methyltransferase
MLGFLLQSPTLPTIVMFPILTYMYVRLALIEEKAIEAEFGDEYRRGVAVAPRFIPRLSLAANEAAESGSNAHSYR